MSVPLLSVTDLCIDARTPEGLRPVLEGVSFSLRPGETLCLAGESGSGKSLTALSIRRLLSPSLRRRSGSIALAGRELTTLPERAMRQLRGGDVAMIFQEPMTSLNPVMTIGAQLTEAIRTHGGAGTESAEARARAMLDAVHITEPTRRLRQYPHELSGGMRQRVMIAMALSCRPKVLIADEPTTALDVTVQAQILKLMRELRGEFRTAIVLITHDMGVVAEMADRVALLRAGRMVEQGPVLDIFERPQAGLHAAIAGCRAAPRQLRGHRWTAARQRRAHTAPDPRPGAVRQGPHRFLWRRAGLVRPPQSRRARRHGRQLRTAGRPHARPRRRERLRQIHHRQGRAGPHPLDRRDRHRRHRHRRPLAPGHEAAAPQGPDDLPGPLRLARPAHVGRRRHRRAARHPRHRAPGGAARACRGAVEARPPVARPRQPLPARVLRRPAPAHLHRPGRWRSSR